VDSPSSGHYFDPAPASASAPRTVRLDLGDLAVELVTDRGVFSGGAVDPGTKLLLAEGPRPDDTPGDLVDLGCGYGPIAAALAARAPRATVWAVDVNERARQLCAANAQRLGLANVRVVAPGDVPAGLRPVGIWSNPPIRVGKAALHELLTTWLGRLADGGRAELVVHRHLGADSLARWLGEQGWSVARLRSRSGYRLLEVAAGGAGGAGEAVAR
jgi:16S rRNA (guanine1207-N2)-methyltransferase